MKKAKNSGTKTKVFEKKGDGKCYKDNKTANRVAGGLKARGKRVKVNGRCVTLA